MTSAHVPASVVRVGGVYVVTGVGNYPQVKPTRPLTIRRDGRKWRLEVDGEFASRHGSLRLSRIAASDPNVRPYSNLTVGDHAKRRRAAAAGPALAELVAGREIVAFAELLVGRTIIRFEPGGFRDGRGGIAYNPVITLDNGARIMFHATETESGVYGVTPTHYK